CWIPEMFPHPGPVFRCCEPTESRACPRCRKASGSRVPRRSAPGRYRGATASNAPALIANSEAGGSGQSSAQKPCHYSYHKNDTIDGSVRQGEGILRQPIRSFLINSLHLQKERMVYFPITAIT